MGNSIESKTQMIHQGMDEIKSTLKNISGQYILIRKDKSIQLFNQWLDLVKKVDGIDNKKKVVNELFHFVQLMKQTVLTNENLAKVVRNKCLEMISHNRIEGAVECYIDLFGYDDTLQEALKGQQVFEEGTNSFKPSPFVVIDIKCE